MSSAWVGWHKFDTTKDATFIILNILYDTSHTNVPNPFLSHHTTTIIFGRTTYSIWFHTIFHVEYPHYRVYALVSSSFSLSTNNFTPRWEEDQGYAYKHARISKLPPFTSYTSLCRSWNQTYVQHSTTHNTVVTDFYFKDVPVQ